MKCIRQLPLPIILGTSEILDSDLMDENTLVRNLPPIAPHDPFTYHADGGTRITDVYRETTDD